MNLELFVTTIKEYRRFAEYLPLSGCDDYASAFDEPTYIAIHVRLILLRKYVSRTDNVYFAKLINESKDNFPDESNYLESLNVKFAKIHSQSFEQILSDGTKLNLYQSIEDVIYGLYLHADQDKIRRISYTNEYLRFFSTRKYVEEIESIVFELYNFLLDKNISEVTVVTHDKAHVINFCAPDFTLQDIKNSPYWSNLYGTDATEHELISMISCLSDEERKIISRAFLFIEELEKDNFSIEALRNMVFESTLEQWGDFSELSSFIKEIKSVGISSKVRFNDEKYAAYVRIFPHTDSCLPVNCPV